MVETQGVTAIVAGATGLVGRELVHKLLEHPSYSRVIALVRREIGISHPKFEERQVSFDRIEEALNEQLLRDSDVFCALGTTIKNAGSQAAFRRVDYEYPLALGRAARRHGAASFVIVTAMGSSEQSKFFYSRVKGEAERDLAALGLKRLVILRPSLLLGDRTESRPAEKITIALSRPLGALMIGPLAKYKAIDSGKVAYAMIAAARNTGPAH
ncbi:oxidoreductase [Paenibacillus pasadenensis]|nr:oxidoreductase [Paenibacillus pasadenensis]MCM3748859.1 oxidoreductase [Paenibacillus pasadenensis]